MTNHECSVCVILACLMRDTGTYREDKKMRKA